MKAKYVVANILVVAILLSCSSIQLGYSLTCGYTDTLPDGTPVSSVYAQLEMFDENDNHLSSPLFDLEKVQYSGGVLQETVLVSGECYLKLFGTQTSAATFYVGCENFPATGDDAIPIKVALSTSNTPPPDGMFETVPNNGTVDITVVDGSGQPVEPTIGQSGSSVPYYVFIKTGTGSMTLTAEQRISLNFDARFENSNATIVSNDNRIILNISDIVEPGEDNGAFIGDEIVEDEHDGVNIQYEEGKENAVTTGILNNSTRVAIINEGKPFCFKLIVDKPGIANVSLKITIKDEDGKIIESNEYTSTRTVYLGKPIDADPETNPKKFTEFDSIEVLDSNDAWIGEGIQGQVELTVVGRAVDLGFLGKSTAKVAIFFK